MRCDEGLFLRRCVTSFDESVGVRVAKTWSGTATCHAPIRDTTM